MLDRRHRLLADALMPAPLGRGGRAQHGRLPQGPLGGGCGKHGAGYGTRSAAGGGRTTGNGRWDSRQEVGGTSGGGIVQVGGSWRRGAGGGTGGGLWEARSERQATGRTAGGERQRVR